MNFATFDLNLLKVLDALFREGSTTRAGARLGLSQSAVSSALTRLRHALNDPLFVRHGNTLVATEFAEGLRHTLPDQLERLQALLSPPKAFDPLQAEGTFKISAADFMAEMLMPQLGDLLLRQAPGLRAQLVDLVPYDYIESLERYEADLALIPDRDLPSWISREPLFRSSFVVVARDGNPGIAGLTPGDIMPFDVFCGLHHVLFSPEGKLSSMGDDALARVGRSRRVAMTVPVFTGVCRVVSESELIALLPRQLAEKVSKEYGLVLFQPPMRVDPALIVGIWHKRADRAPMASWMREQVFNLLRRLDAPI
ncbi:LysR family transcriptional regulator [Marivita sp. XM-24bin2]|jgi:DNA-binding transcriptional LysR family regulator|uniref:LysR family transcriptional regulator n=1 Tax=unclassified Marivita TaxID=2632480 RepID=UPI000D790371|nr:LysR family transcriptional regulator [Marivita sp. XM-24bin2]MCR9109914.1 LysR family transcriptional regulator [Paracoccaceae bacterium]PWL36399.1 MAG: LysR family transcriptional regulator [Marivita sp. XM-24bin2]